MLFVPKEYMHDQKACLLQNHPTWPEWSVYTGIFHPGQARSQQQMAGSLIAGIEAESFIHKREFTVRAGSQQTSCPS